MRTNQLGLAVSLIFMTTINAAYALAPRSVFDTHKKKPVIVPLTEAEKEALKPQYQSVRGFRADYTEWKKSHPHARLIWMSRHGESYSNVFELTQHPTAYSPLTSRGRLHAAALADFLKDVDFDQIISSDAERTYMTVRGLAEREEKTAQIKIDPRIQEFSFWPAGNMPLKETLRVFADLAALLYVDPRRYAAPGQISLADFKTRLGQLLGELSKDEHENTLLGTHGMTIVLAVMEALNIPLEKYWAAAPFLPFSGFTGITILSYDFDTQKWELLVYADNSYLPEELKGKRQSSSDLETEYYDAASIRLELLKQGKGSLGLSDFFPTDASFTRLSPAKVRESLEAVKAIETAA